MIDDKSQMGFFTSLKNYTISVTSSEFQTYCSWKTSIISTHSPVSINSSQDCLQHTFVQVDKWKRCQTKDARIHLNVLHLHQSSHWKSASTLGNSSESSTIWFTSWAVKCRLKGNFMTQLRTAWQLLILAAKRTTHWCPTYIWRRRIIPLRTTM